VVLAVVEMAVRVDLVAAETAMALHRVELEHLAKVLLVVEVLMLAPALEFHLAVVVVVELQL
jgi:hypothetical protein